MRLSPLLLLLAFACVCAGGALAFSTDNSNAEREVVAAAAAAAPSNSTTPPAPAPPSSSPVGCSANTDCKSCAKDGACVWCEDGDGSCLDAWTPLGLGSKDGTCKLFDKGDFRFKQCALPGRTALAIAGGIVGVLLLVFIIVCCCCCRKCKRGRGERKMTKYEEFKNIQDADDETQGLFSAESKHPKTDARRAELMAKYGGLRGSRSPQNSFRGSSTSARPVLLESDDGLG
jgi:PTTG1-interacting protein